MWRSRTVRELLRQHQQELARRDEMIQQLCDRIQHPARTPIWREPFIPTQAESPPQDWMYDPENLDG